MASKDVIDQRVEVGASADDRKYEVRGKNGDAEANAERSTSNAQRRIGALVIEKKEVA